MEEIILAILFFGSVYSYILYPCILHVICLWRTPKNICELKEYDSTFEAQAVTIIIAAHNEIKGIENKINNLLNLKQEYPQLEIIIASDCSTDGTDAICEKYANNNDLIFIRSPVRGGKEVAQHKALCLAQGKIIVFSDVSTLIYKECLSNILKYFSIAQVGAVSSQDARLNGYGAKDSEGLYLRYELWIRKMESQLAGCVGMSGSFFAVRKEFCLPWCDHICSDFNIALNTVRAGSLVISASDVFGYYPSLKNVADEHTRRVRTVIRGMVGLYKNRDILIPFKNPLFAFQIFSHKLMRWLSPWFFIALFIVLAFFWSENLFNTIVFLGQLLLLLLYVLSRVFVSLRQNIMLKLPVFFMESNLSVVEAGIQFLRGERMKIWKPSRR
jgi:glycosyltransferase involved in cell wall biosynthesis